MRLKQFLVTISILVGGLALALFIDGRRLAPGISQQAVMFAIVSVVGALIYGIFALRNKLETTSVIHEAGVAFVAWTLFSILFGLRSLQVVQVSIVLVLGLLLSIFIGYLWVHEDKTAASYERLIALLAFEWFAVMLFAPASFLVLGALTTIATIVSGMVFELSRLQHTDRKSIGGVVLIGAVIFLIFVIGFRWTL